VSNLFSVSSNKAVGRALHSKELRGQILNCHILGRLFDRETRPPDKQKKATDTVIQQAELLGEDWAQGEGE